MRLRVNEAEYDGIVDKSRRRVIELFYFLLRSAIIRVYPRQNTLPTPHFSKSRLAFEFQFLKVKVRIWHVDFHFVDSPLRVQSKRDEALLKRIDDCVSPCHPERIKVPMLQVPNKERRRQETEYEFAFLFSDLCVSKHLAGVGSGVGREWK